MKSIISAVSPEFAEYFNKRRLESNIYTRIICPKDELVSFTEYPYLASSKQLKRDIRIAPSDMSFQVVCWLYAGKAAIISTGSDPYGYILESKELYEWLSSQFELVWGLASPIQTATGQE